MVSYEHKLKNAYLGAPNSWWKPWADTLLYMPLDWDLLDYSWNNNNWTAIWTIQFQTIWNKQYAYFNNNSAIQLITIPVWTWNPSAFTQSCRFKTNSNWRWCMHEFWSRSNNSRSKVWFYDNWYPIQDRYGVGYDLYMWSVTTSVLWNTRIHVIYTYNNWNHQFYINWSLRWTATGNLNISWTTYRYIWTNSGSWYAWYAMSENIFESKVWTQQEISDYFNKTKVDYWIQ